MPNLNMLQIKRGKASHSPSWHVSQELLNAWGVASGEMVKVILGQKSWKMPLTGNPYINPQDIVVPGVLDLPRQKIGAVYREEGTKILRLGPVIGILTADGSSSAPNRPPMAGRLHFFADLLTTMPQAGALAFCVTPKGFDFRAGLCKGYIVVNGKWKSVTWPIPDVIYNRVPMRQLEQSSGIKWVKNQFDARNIPYFNPHFLNKWMLHGVLEKTDVKDILPETLLLKSLGQVSSFLQKYGSIYLKPIGGFAGHGILRISRARRGFVVQYRQNNHNFSHLCGDGVSLKNKLASLMGKRQYIVQQGLSLATYRGRTFDIRLLVQRDGQGIWGLTGWGCRVAGLGSITTHVPNGGAIAGVKPVMKAVFGSKKDDILDQVKTAALAIPTHIERYYGRTFGMLSMDIGIDQQGQIWFFEANSKPMEFDEELTQKKSTLKLVHYSRYIADFWGEEG